MGWGGVIAFSSTSATSYVLLPFHTYVMLRWWTFSCTSTHTSCYAAGCSLALPHIRHATLLCVLLHFHAYVMLRCWTFFCTSTHTSCYAAGRSLALPHIRHATLLDVLLRSLARCDYGTFPRSSSDTKLHFRCGKTLDFPILRRPFHGILTAHLLKKNVHSQITTVSDVSTFIL